LHLRMIGRMLTPRVLFGLIPLAFLTIGLVNSVAAGPPPPPVLSEREIN